MKYKPIKNIGQVVSGSTPKRLKPEYWNGHINWASLKDISNLKGPFLTSTLEKITELGYKSCSTQMLPKGTVLLSSRAPIGHLAVSKIKVCTNQGFKSIIPNDDVNSLYLYYSLKHKIEEVKDLGTGTTFTELSKKRLEKFELPFPETINDQKRIAQVLTDCDELIAKRKESIALLDELLKSTFLEMFGDPVINEKKWPKIEGQKLFEVRGRVGWKGYKKTDLRESGPMVLGATHITDSGGIDISNSVHLTREKFLESPEIIIQKNDLLFVQRGNTIGKTGLINYDIKESTINPVLLILRPSSADSQFLLHLFLNKNMHKKIINLNSGSAQPMITQKSIREHEFINPPPQSLQNSFMEVAVKVEGIKKLYQNHLNELETLYGRLSQDAFKGELDLSKVVLREEFSIKEENLKNSKVELPITSGEGETKEKRLTKKEIKQLESNLKKKKRKKDITHLSLPDFLGVPEEIQSTREKVEFDLGLDNLFFQFTLKDTFKKGQAFTFEEIENRLHDYFYYTGDMDFPYEQFKNAIFDFMDNQPPLVEQFFDDNDAQIKLRLTDEAFKA